MRKLYFALALIASIAELQAAAPLHKVPGAVSERYLVVLNPDTPAGDLASPLAREVRGQVVHVYSTVLNGFSIRANEQAALALTRKKDVSPYGKCRQSARRPSSTAFLMVSIVSISGRCH